MISSSFGGMSGFSRTADVGVPIQNGFEDHPRTFAAERQRPGRHLVQHRAEREQVGAGIEFLASHLLRRHVGDGAQRRTGAGQMLLRVDGRGARSNALRLAATTLANPKSRIFA